MEDRILNVYIIDDDPVQVAGLAKKVKGCSKGSLLDVKTLTSAEELESLLSGGKRDDVDLLISDMDLGNGIRAPRIIKKHLDADSRCQVIYITGNLDMVPEAYDTPHVYTLAKPLKTEHLEDALERVFSYEAEQPEKSEYLVVKSEGSVLRLAIDSILWLESARHRVVFRTEEGKSHATYETLSGSMQKLPKSFIQVHKSFVVNLDKVVRMGKDELSFTDGSVVPVSRKFHAEVKSAYMAHLASSL